VKVLEGPAQSVRVLDRGAWAWAVGDGALDFYANDNLRCIYCVLTVN
jgi:hypothetical protein